MHLPSYITGHDLSISLNIYCTGYFPATTQRSFSLRNLKGDSLEQQADQARQLLDKVAEELHYLTGFGIDKGIVKAGSTKLTQVLYPELKPRLEKMYFMDGLLLQFWNPYYYQWVKDNQAKVYLSEAEVAQGWQKVVKRRSGTVSFRLPVIALPRSEGDYMSFFRYSQPLKRKRKRTSYGFSVTYDRNDPIFTRFLARFYEEGELSFGDLSYFVASGETIRIEGRDWPKSKVKPKKTPRRSRLASQPADATEYVYVIQAGRTNLFKIGKSNDPQGRLESMQTANPYKLKLLHYFKADNATTAEEALHQLLHPGRMEGEWFKLNPAQKQVIASIQRFEQGQFWRGKVGMEPSQLFVLSNEEAQDQ